MADCLGPLSLITHRLASAIACTNTIRLAGLLDEPRRAVNPSEAKRDSTRTKQYRRLSPKTKMRKWQAAWPPSRHYIFSQINSARLWKKRDPLESVIRLNEFQTSHINRTDAQFPNSLRRSSRVSCWFCGFKPADCKPHCSIVGWLMLPLMVCQTNAKAHTTTGFRKGHNSTSDSSTYLHKSSSSSAHCATAGLGATGHRARGLCEQRVAGPALSFCP